MNNYAIDYSIQTKISEIKLLILDVDGVLTDGKIWLMPDGEETKCFHIQDGLGIKRLQQAGIIVAVITGRKSKAVNIRMQELGIKHYFSGQENKTIALNILLENLQIELNEVAYMGDDLPDFAVMQKVGLPIAVANAVPEIKKIAVWLTQKSGGEGAVREVCDRIIAQVENKTKCPI